MAITIRKAQQQDCPRLLELIYELAHFVNAPEDVTVSLGHFQDSGFGKDPVWYAFVAENDGYIIGFALYYIRYSTWKGQRMYLEDLLVTHDFRGKGVGTLLFNTLIQEAKAKNFSGIAWQVLDWNETAISFYNKYNARFEEDWINCSISLE